MNAIKNRAPLTAEEVMEYLNNAVEKTTKQWGENNFYTDMARKKRDKNLAEYNAGLVILVYSVDYCDHYGNGTGDFSDTLYSDGHVETTCFGYSD